MTLDEAVLELLHQGQKTFKIEKTYSIEAAMLISCYDDFVSSSDKLGKYLINQKAQYTQSTLSGRIIKCPPANSKIRIIYLNKYL